ncbi:MAG: BamA/TamA family outer membrane protein [Prevotella sp.]|nr:BamA/TamA family outer membrane protein [Prevotella sp.]
MLNSVELRSDPKGFNTARLEPYVRQKPNSKWFSLFKIPLGVYSMSGRDSTKWINRTLRNIGEEPVIFDTLQASLTCNDLQTAMRNMGYLHADVDLTTSQKGKKLDAIYTLKPGPPYDIRHVTYDIADSRIDSLMRQEDSRALQIQSGEAFTVERLDAERKRLTTFLMDRGYYRFNKDYIRFTVDSAQNSNEVDVTLHLVPYTPPNSTLPILHPQYTVRSVSFSGEDRGLSAGSSKLGLRRKVLENNTAIQLGLPFSSADLQRTYNNFSRLQAVKYTNIKYREVPDSQLLDCDIMLSMNKPSSISFQPEGTNTAGDLGAAASLTFENRNLFRGSEVLSVQLRAAFEAITGLEGYQNQDYEEYSLETKLAFPRMVAPFLSRDFKRRSTATSELTLAYDLQNRPEFHRRVFTAAWRYRWSNPKRHVNYRFDLLDLNYVYMPWISSTFKHDYLDSVSNRNAILRYNYEDLFIMKIGFGITYSYGNHALRANIETSGNLLSAVSGLAHFRKNDNDQYTLFNIAYAQYAKFDFDYTRLWPFDQHNQLVFHADFGIAYPYGNSTILPFEKRYFSGGANSVRGWSVRELGPGKFRGTDGRIDFINQTGDMKIDLNLEYRTLLFWKINGAAFIDAGNIWTLRNYAEQPGGQFKFHRFLSEMAVAYGFGLRLNFDYFILRLDLGMKAINPAYETNREHYPILHPKLSRDLSFHFAVGLPF